VASTDTAPAGVDNNVTESGVWVRETVRPATLVTVESLGPMIPGRYLGTGPHAGTVRVKVTASRPGYLKGETITVPASRVLLRSQVYTRRGQIMVRNRPLRFVDGPPAERRYRGFTITRTASSGMWLASGLGHLPLKADTMAGLRALITHTLRSAR
jgi:hypothetical protein